jgi:hypothetical protein
MMRLRGRGLGDWWLGRRVEVFVVTEGGVDFELLRLVMDELEMR